MHMRFLRPVLITALFLAAAPAAQAYDVTVSVSADPLAGKAATITAKGTSDAARDLFVYVEKGATSCAPTASSQDALTGPTAISKPVNGAFTETASFTPDAAASYRVCAYISQGSAAVPDASGFTSFSSRAGATSISLTPPPDPTVGQTGTIAVAGSSELSRRLYVYVQKAGPDCAATAGAQNSRSGPSTTNGRAVTGSFTESDKFKPDAVAAYRVCAYLSASLTAVPDTVQTIVFSARASSSGIQLGASGNQNGFGAAVSVSGRTDRKLKLYVVARRGGGSCASTVRAQQRASRSVTVVNNVSVQGAYSRTANLATQPVTNYALCAYLTSSTTAKPSAGASSRFVATGVRATPLRRQSLIRRRVVLVSVVCGEACTLKASGKVAGGRLKGVSRTLQPFRRATLRLRVPKRALRRMRSQVRRKKTIRAKVSVRQAGGRTVGILIFSRK
ncbi:MAG: hypothetical protein H0V29_01745 [Thermoleophilaceae bacterium]|nr:hypothetical protein [Thermoleophilaceae bacterium]